jgi:hypothetical protein
MRIEFGEIELSGDVMTKYGFGPAFCVISISYFLAMSLLMLLRMPHKEKSLANI